MKRVKSACICQTLHFTLKDGLDHLYAVKQVKEEVETYKKNMERNHTKYKIVEQTEQPDSSIIVKIIKQVQRCTCGRLSELISATKRPLPFKNGGGLLRPADLPLVKRIGKRLNCSIIVYFKIQSYTFWCVYKSEHLCRNQQRRKVCHVKPS